MVNSCITEYLKYYLKLDNPQYAVLLTGKWGCGKTYYIRQMMAKWDQRNDSNTAVILKPIYVSLNGIDNVDTINNKIKNEISSFITKVGSLTKSILKGLVKTSLKIDIDFNNDGETDGNISFNPDLLDIFRSRDKRIKGDKILIFDDIERCKIETDKIFGYVNNFVEHLGCKVILLTDEEKLKSKYENGNNVSYNDFKEKLIGQTFEVNSDVSGAIDVFIEECKRINSDLDLSDNNDLIIRIFKASEKENLRVLRQALLDFHRFTTFFDDSFASHARYDEFIKNILAYFLIIHLELKTGNEGVYKFQNPIHDYLSEDNEKEMNYTKYQLELDRAGIHNSMYILPLDNIIQYIKKGSIEKDLLKNLMINSIFFLTDRTPNWEKLWRWKDLDDRKFRVLKDSVWKEFVQGDITEPLVVTHIADILISLIDEGLLQKKKGYVVAKSKQILNTLCMDEYFKKNNRYGILSNTREYHSSSSPELKEIVNYLHEKLEQNRKHIYDSHVKGIFENLHDGEDINNQIYPKLTDTLPDYSTQYEYSAIFSSVDGKKMARRIKELVPRSIRKFQSFIHYRYFPEERFSNGRLEVYHKDDMKCLIELKDELLKGFKKREIIKNMAITDLVEELGAVISKLELKGKETA